MQRIKYTLEWALRTAAENASHDARKTFGILAAKLLNTLLKFVLSFHLLLLTVWLLSSSGVQLALRGSAVREPIWESQLVLADSTCCWNTCWQSCGSYLGSWQQFLTEAVRKVSCLELKGQCWRDDSRGRWLSIFSGMVTAPLLQV